MFYGENYSVHQSHSQNVSRDLRGVAGQAPVILCVMTLAHLAV